jgi:hypothetical protein
MHLGAEQGLALKCAVMNRLAMNMVLWFHTQLLAHPIHQNNLSTIADRGVHCSVKLQAVRLFNRVSNFQSLGPQDLQAQVQQQPGKTSRAL